MGERDLWGGLRGCSTAGACWGGGNAREFGEGVKECVQDVKWCVGDIRIMGKMELWVGGRGMERGEGDVVTTL